MAVETSSWLRQSLSNGRYHVLAKLGEGGMGVVYHAHDQNLDSDVVIKVPRRSALDDPVFAERFSREIRSPVRLVHPHIVKILDVGEHGGLPFAVMQYLPGGTLDDRRPRSANGQPMPLPLESLTSWLPQIGGALDFIHAQGYVHRDVKPGNILFDQYGHAFLSDFGVAKIIRAHEDGPQTGKVTKTGFALGTPDYMAPELSMTGNWDGRVDQYALAVTTFELLTGRCPYTGPTPMAVLMAHSTQQPPVLSQLDARIPAFASAAVATALAKKPDDRFSDCSGFVQALLGGRARSAMLPEAHSHTAGANNLHRPLNQHDTSSTDAGSSQCPACGKSLPLKDKHRGKRVRCPSCQSVLHISDNLQTTSLDPTIAASRLSPRQQLSGEASAGAIGTLTVPLTSPAESTFGASIDSTAVDAPHTTFWFTQQLTRFVFILCSVATIGIGLLITWHFRSKNGAAIADVTRSPSWDNSNPSNMEFSFSSAATYSVQQQPSGVILIDFDADKTLDVVVANLGSGSLTLLRGNGDGTLEIVRHIPIAKGAGCVESGDFNGDGVIDLITANYGDSRSEGSVSVLLGLGNGHFDLPIHTTGIKEPSSVAVADFNKDGQLDAVVNNQANGLNRIQVLFGDGSGSFTIKGPYSTGPGARRVATGDVNSDRWTDIVVANSNSGGKGSASVLLNDQNGAFPKHKVISLGNGPEGVSLGDFNEDGALDFAVTNNASNTISIVLNAKNGRFRTSGDVSAHKPTGIIVSDFNLDDHVDIAFASMSEKGHVCVFQGKGDGTFLPRNVLETGAGPVYLASADLSGDDMPDIVVVDIKANAVHVFVNSQTSQVPVFIKPQ